MKYYEEKNLYVSEEGLVYDKINDEYVQRKLVPNGDGYLKTKGILVHRLVWELFNGPIPQGFEIDHINAVKDDNRLVNLRLVTHSENLANPITRKRRSEAMKGSKNPAYGKKPWNKGLKGTTKVSEERKERYSQMYKGKHWKIVNGKREWY